MKLDLDKIDIPFLKAPPHEARLLLAPEAPRRKAA